MFSDIAAAKKRRFDTVTLSNTAFTRMAFRFFNGYLFLYNEVIFPVFFLAGQFTPVNSFKNRL